MTKLMMMMSFICSCRNKKYQVVLYHTVVTTPSTNWIGKNAVFFNIIGWGPLASHPNIIAARSRRSVLCPP